MQNIQSNDLIKLHVLTSAEERIDFHQDMELFYVLEGTLSLQFSDRKAVLMEGDILCVNANESYSCSASEGNLFVRLTVPLQLIEKTSGSLNVVFRCDSTRKENSNYAELRNALRQMLMRHPGERNQEGDFGYYSACCSVLDILTRCFLIRASDREQARKKAQYEERIAQINNYINKNYNRQISSRELAKNLFLSQSYLARFFKKNYGVSFAEYLKNIRLYHAVDALLYSDKTMARIAADCGFPNTATMNRAFRNKYGKTPLAMRRELRKSQDNQDKKVQTILTSFFQGQTKQIKT